MDERIRETIARLFPADKVWNIRPYVAADMVLAALRVEGFEWYRPDECLAGRICDSGKRDYYDPVIRAVPTNTLLEALPEGSLFRLVPVETPKENE